MTSPRVSKFEIPDDAAVEGAGNDEEDPDADIELTLTDVSIESGVLLTLNKVPTEKKRNEESLELDLDEAAVADLLRPPEAMDEARKPPIGSVQSSPAFKLRPKLKLDLSPLKINTSTVSSGSRNSDGARKNPYLAANKLML